MGFLTKPQTKRRVIIDRALLLFVSGLAGGGAAAMAVTDMDESAAEGWGEDAALVIDEGNFKI